MAISKHNLKHNSCKLTSFLKKNGMDFWFYSFNAHSETSGEEKSFFIELQIINPYISPDKVVFSTLSDVLFSEENLAAMISENSIPAATNSKDTTVPSYVRISAGCYGAKSKYLNKYVAPNLIKINKKESSIIVNDCFFSNSKLIGQLQSNPESCEKLGHMAGDFGKIEWNIEFRKEIDFSKRYNKNKLNWFSAGAKTLFAGKISIDGEVFVINPRKCGGYTDRNWGNGFPRPFIHLSSSSMQSMISGKELTHSCFSIQGLYEKKLCAFYNLAGKELQFIPGKTKYTSTWECSQIPKIEDEEKLHWTVSVSDSKYLIDVDIFCNTNDLCVKTSESAKEENKLFKVLETGNAIGEIRLYKKVKKTIELIEHAQITKSLCKYGVEDES